MTGKDAERLQGCWFRLQETADSLDQLQTLRFLKRLSPEDLATHGYLSDRGILPDPGPEVWGRLPAVENVSGGDASPERNPKVGSAQARHGFPQDQRARRTARARRHWNYYHRVEVRSHFGSEEGLAILVDWLGTAFLGLERRERTAAHVRALLQDALPEPPSADQVGAPDNLLLINEVRQPSGAKSLQPARRKRGRPRKVQPESETPR